LERLGIVLENEGRVGREREREKKGEFWIFVKFQDFLVIKQTRLFFSYPY